MGARPPTKCKERAVLLSTSKETYVRAIETMQSVQHAGTISKASRRGHRRDHAVEAVLQLYLCTPRRRAPNGPHLGVIERRPYRLLDVSTRSIGPGRRARVLPSHQLRLCSNSTSARLAAAPQTVPILALLSGAGTVSWTSLLGASAPDAEHESSRPTMQGVQGKRQPVPFRHITARSSG